MPVNTSKPKALMCVAFHKTAPCFCFFHRTSRITFTAVRKEKTSFALNTDGLCIKPISLACFSETCVFACRNFMFLFKSKSGRAAILRLLGYLLFLSPFLSTTRTFDYSVGDADQTSKKQVFSYSEPFGSKSYCLFLHFSSSLFRQAPVKFKTSPSWAEICLYWRVRIHPAFSATMAI